MVRDEFNRTQTSGWGSTDTGQAWVLNNLNRLSVNGSAGVLAVDVGRRYEGMLDTSAGDVSVLTSIATTATATGSGAYVSAVQRKSSTQLYTAKVQYSSTGAPTLTLVRQVGSTETTLASLRLGTTPAANQMLHLRFEAEGTSPVRLRARTWTGATEPTAWTLTASDATAGFQTPTVGVGISAYVSSTATAAATVLVDRLEVSRLAPPPNRAPSAGLTSSVTGLTVTADARTSTDPDGDALTYAWAFGDGATATGATTSHTFAAAGTYPMVLTVTDSRGATNQVSVPVTVAPPPNASPVAAFTPTTTDLTVLLDATSSFDPDGSVSGYAWDFGDGSSASGVTATHTYAAAGAYVVTLTVTDDRGATNAVSHEVTATAPNAPPTAAFTSVVTGLTLGVDASTSSDPEGGALTYAWDFGDGATGTGTTAQHTYSAAGTYAVVLRAVDPGGLAATSTATVTVQVAPVGPTAVLGTTTSGLTVQLDGSASHDPDGGTLTYAWEYGDGATGTGATTSHNYATAGTYTVRLTVTDDEGETAWTEASVSVAPRPPTAAFGVTVTDLTLAVDASVSTDPDGGALTYAWDFGDGATGSGATASHTYAAAGTFRVGLVVTDAEGLTDATARDVTVAAPNRAPVAAFTGSADGLRVDVDATSSTDPDGDALSYAWAFGDGSTGSGVAASHTYAAGGTFTVTLTVSDARGATSSATRSFAVVRPNLAPVAVFSSSVSGLTVSVNGSGSTDPEGGVLTYAWDFGDGTTGTGATATRTYATAGTYTVALTVTDDRGATHRTTAAVTVTAPPATTLVAADTFTRTTTNGWGTADTGGTWAVNGTASRYTVTGGTARATLTATGSTLAQLPASTRDVDVTTQLSFSTRPAASTAQAFLATRAAGWTQEYRTKTIINPAGTVVLQISAINTTETSLAYVIVPGLTYTAGQNLTMRVQTEGTNPTTLRARVWPTGTTEPTTWHATATDTTTPLQDAGTLGLGTWAGSTATFPLTTTFDTYTATAMG
ncbi:PKD domain-containing protein [Miniimonas sp. S16]|uniref:PKD domain-containing protein n=1 Tax=Miniimonas sp. S16 TaxID=2171623 RepID=UPI000D529D8A|nr:PKD domain-containing protein [Miniimonas sp. S16]